ncbi:hypothetical protein DSCA_52590 [Desulfosarcina alkanivorans]|uniref:Uncharacterized protein n=1 Tax=Desulfosarcina alkanivorans TaxID=571177 RepID=A0A5K7YTK9_9BACT|nr:hypothetical protein [Desulfosarcina alkanivorans]BBO71329.1 hypothetical protein DSCA_52590 [Desulfosarcina alkanivorans]
MTYNFDPDRWYDNELAVLDDQLKTGRISPAAYEAAKDELEGRYDAMVARLDGTYRIGAADGEALHGRRE